jgi:t-SNARE complex subunit (syntaxin)
MKSYILDLKEKLSKALIGKKEVDKKYRSLKEKLTEKAEKSIMFEEQNKLLKGKLEGFERLTDRLQFELQKSIEDHEEEVNKMKSMTSNIIAKKTEEVKVANAYVRAQLDYELDKF